MIEVALSLLIANQPFPGPNPAPEPTLAQRGWELVHSVEKSRKIETYIHPDSIKPASKQKDIFSVNLVINWEKRDGTGWRVYSLGSLVDCESMSYSQEWNLRHYDSGPVIDYLRKPITFKKAEGRQLAVAKRVCEKP